MGGSGDTAKRLRDAERVRAWKLAHPDRVSELNRNSYQRRKILDPTFMERQRSQQRAQYAAKFRNNPRAIREQNLQQNYGLTLEEYDSKLAKQGGVRMICGTNKPEGRGNNFFVDHDHETGAVRGLLCNHCNRGLGGFRDNVQLLQKALGYLQYFAKNSEVV